MREFISILKHDLLNFYEYKRISGFKYISSYDVLIQFDRYYDSLNLKDIQMTREVIEPFLYLKENERISNQHVKASVIRQFTNYLLENEIISNAYIITPISVKGEANFVPFIYTKENLHDIIDFLQKYKSNNIKPFTTETMVIVFKTLMSTGMRISEVTNLKNNDVDLNKCLFTIREAKNNNQRLIPFSNALRDDIKNYLLITKLVYSGDDYLFSIKPNERLRTNKCYFYLRKAIASLGIKENGTHSPTIHAFRHTYATMALAQLQRNENNINLSLSYLSSYLGHKSINETQKYLWLTPELFEDTKIKMEEYSSFIGEIFKGEKYDED